jgi:hypothetical protein
MIYFIKAKEYVKIGYSVDPNARLLELQTGNPHKLKLLATMPGETQTEASLHKLFEKCRVNGEWFKYDRFLKACIMAINDPHNNFDVTDVRSLQKAGLHLHLRQKANRSKNVKFRSRIKKHKIGPSQIAVVIQR